MPSGKSFAKKGGRGPTAIYESGHCRLRTKQQQLQDKKKRLQIGGWSAVAKERVRGANADGRGKQRRASHNH